MITAQLAAANTVGLRRVRIDLADGKAFDASADFLPRVGETIVLDDGRAAEVEAVYHQVVEEPEEPGRAGACSIVPTIVAKVEEFHAAPGGATE